MLMDFGFRKIKLWWNYCGTHSAKEYLNVFVNSFSYAVFFELCYGPKTKSFEHFQLKKGKNCS